jgi:hypothetical protein
MSQSLIESWRSLTPLTKFSCIFAVLIHDAGNLIAMVLVCIDVFNVMCILNVYPLLIHFHQTTKEYQTLSFKRNTPQWQMITKTESHRRATFSWCRLASFDGR